MTIYVDDLHQYPNGWWCHMATDGDLEALHAFALALGLKREWFQNHPRMPHYDLRPTKRALAITHGAVPLKATDVFKRCAKKSTASKIKP